jgi:hypothetical protein
MNQERLGHALTAALLAFTASPVVAQFPLLESPSRAFHTGSQVVTDAHRPQHTASADMDGDGDADLVIAHAGNLVSPKVSVMKNLGHGTFADPVNYDAPGQTMEVVLADFDGDGDPDAAFAQSNDGSAGSRVLVFENAGDGSLLPYVSYTVGTGPTGLVATDVDKDGDFDLVTANFFWMQEDVTVLYNDGTGAFPSRADFAIPGENPVKVAAGDLTGDGAPELVVSLDSANPAFAVLENNGNGAFGPPTFQYILTMSWHQADVAVADVDKDGDNDVLYGTAGLVETGGPGGFALFRNTGGGTLGALESFAFDPEFNALYDIAVADVTGDGWPDVLGTAKMSQEGFVLVPGDGTGSFGPATGYRAGEYSRAVTTADVDGDGDLDAIVTNHSSLTVTVHENDGTGFSKPTAFSLGAYLGDVAAGDLDKDGDIDLLTGDQDGFLLLDNLGDGTFALFQQATGPAQMSRLKLRDLDGDSYLDALFVGGTALNDGTGKLGTITAFPLFSGTQDVETLDMDHDGDLDVVVSGYVFSQEGFFVHPNDGSGTLGTATFFGSSAVLHSGRLATGDFTGDSHEDVITAVPGGFWLWAGDGTGQFGAPVFVDFGLGGTANMTSGDFDGDGHLDVAGSDWGAPPEGETLTVVFGNGNGTFTAPLTYYAMFSQWYGGVNGLDSGDVDGDGDLDLFGGCWAANDVAVFLNNGNRTFATELRYGIDGNVTGITSGDFDGDGRDDVAATFELAVPWLPSKGGGVTVLLGFSPDSYASLGFGLAGSAGVPVLVGSGTPAPSAPVAFHLSGAAPLAPSLMVASLGRVDLPIFGGVLVPTPEILIPFVTLGDGGYTLGATWPASSTTGTTVYLQTWTIDALAVQGLSASNALEATQQL